MPYLNHCTAGFSGETSLLVLETAPAAAEKIKGFCIAKPMQKPRWIEPGRDRGLTEVYGIFRMRSCALAGWAAACVYAFTSRLVPGCGRRLADSIGKSFRYPPVWSQLPQTRLGLRRKPSSIRPPVWSHFIKYESPAAGRMAARSPVMRVEIRPQRPPAPVWSHFT
jgi:hypothetical protein